MQRSDAEARAGGFPLPRLIDLISFKKERYRVAFYKAVGDTVVAPDMDEASKIAYSQRRRVVTLDGGLIEVDGRMVGGGVRERSGAGQGIRVSEGPSVETITEEEEDNLPELREEIREKEQRLRSLLRESVSPASRSFQKLEKTKKPDSDGHTHLGERLQMKSAEKHSGERNGGNQSRTEKGRRIILEENLEDAEHEPVDGRRKKSEKRAEHSARGETRKEKWRRQGKMKFGKRERTRRKGERRDDGRLPRQREDEESEESLARLNTQEEETESSLVLLRQDIQAAERQVHEVTERLASQSKESLSSEEKKKMGMLQKEVHATHPWLLGRPNSIAL
ncbi:RecF/RecN/SMC N terminal domain-containing protein [Toxoplasma gondii FOU]|uniref:RecF/RecN/SMC N terminal domain-containing protein n=2 Tax=Toxoplasma gondii TaxID=5811 RepID=A0A086LFK2_TOXGO|nr:RecF/RecN/SMC N terminal domain-containing protein [Toxoplasma gondii FOU]PUA92758.1 putative structural maintenance of chromosomes protein [Toxoplasma gondii TgCATBr9]